MSNDTSLNTLPKQLSIRQSNIELLRIIAALSIITIHIGDRILRLLEWNTSNQVLSFFLESYAHCAVDVFILITGYFSCMSDRRTVGKPFSLVFQVLLVCVARYVAIVIAGNTPFNIKTILYFCTPADYFVVLFVALYFISPYLNKILCFLSSQGQKRLLIICLVIFSFYPTIVDLYGEIIGKPWFGLSSIGAWGSQKGFNIVNFCLLYLVGAYLKMNDIPQKISHRKALVYLLISWIVVFGWAEMCHFLSTEGLYSAWVYHNPFIIIMAVSSFVLFFHFHFTSRLINSLAGAAFMCYIIHTKLLDLFDFNSIANMPCFKMLGLLLCLVIGMYLLAWIIKFMYDAVFGKIMKRVDKKEIKYI